MLISSKGYQEVCHKGAERLGILLLCSWLFVLLVSRSQFDELLCKTNHERADLYFCSIGVGDVLWALVRQLGNMKLGFVSTCVIETFWTSGLHFGCRFLLKTVVGLA